MRLILSLFFCASLASAGEAIKTIELEWDPVQNAGGYEVKLTPVRGEPLLFPTAENHLIQAVPLGSYKLQIRSRAKDGDEFSEWSPATTLEVAVKEIIPLNPENNSTIINAGTAKQTVEFRWSPVDKIKIYTLKVWSESRKETPWVFTGRATSKKLEVPPGEVYYWQVSFESADDVSYQQEPQTFSFTLQGTKLVRPEINSQVARHAPKSLSWKPSPEATTYLVKLSYRALDETAWTSLREESLKTTGWDMQKMKPGMYKIEVVAQAPRRQSSDVAALEFAIKPTQLELEAALAGTVQR